MRRALVTGSGGFIGKHVVSELRRQSIEVRTLHFRVTEDGTGPRFRLDGGVETGHLVELIREAVPDAIFHLAGTVDVRLLFDVNVDYAARLIDAVRRAGPPATILLTGSAAEYGHPDGAGLPVSERSLCQPLTPYGISKHAQTLIGLAAAAAGSRVIVARLFNVVGSGMPPHLPLMDIAIRLAASETTGKLTVGNLDTERDFIDASDVAGSLVGLSSHREMAGHVVNLCCGQGIWLRQLVERMTASVPWRVSLVKDERLLQPGSITRMVGRPDKLAQLGFRLPPPDFDALLPAIVGAAIRDHQAATRVNQVAEVGIAVNQES